MRILIIHGPSLNLLGTREPDVYGHRTLPEIDDLLRAYGNERKIEIATCQTNHEGTIIDLIHASPEQKVSAIVINPGAYTHTSMAIADAIRAVPTPVVEVHLSNLFARGPERARSVTASACRGIVSGFGYESYLIGIDAAARLARPARASRKQAAKKSSRRGARKKRS